MKKLFLSVTSVTMLVMLVGLTSCKSSTNSTDENTTPTEQNDEERDLSEESIQETPVIEEEVVEEPVKETVVEKKSPWIGKFYNEHDFSIEIKSVGNDGAIAFRLLQMSQDCIGDIEATAYMVGPNNAEFYDNSSNCMVKLKLIGESVIQVYEEDCQDYRGLYCANFSGAYNKK